MFFGNENFELISVFFLKKINRKTISKSLNFKENNDVESKAIIGRGLIEDL